MKKIDIETMKKIEFDMLVELDKFCRKNGLKVFLGGGTLLGAVRHKGFIPWDDDIDVMMMREDYEKLLDLAKKGIGENYKILSCNYNSDYYYAFAKMVDNRTTIVETDYNNIEGMGVFVDIFPIDYAPKSDFGKKMIFKKRALWYKLNAFPTGTAETKEAKNIFKKIGKKILVPMMKIMPRNLPAKRVDAILRNKTSGDEVVCVSGRYKEKEIMPVSAMADSVEVEFEGRKYYAPIGYHEYLVKHYGENYMQIPPKEKQVSNHDNEAYWREK